MTILPFTIPGRHDITPEQDRELEAGLEFELRSELERLNALSVRKAPVYADPKLHRADDGETFVFDGGE